MFSAGRRLLSWVRVLEREAVPSRAAYSNSRNFRSIGRRIGKYVCIGAVTLPIGFSLASHLARLVRPVAMADCATQPAVSEIVSRADELYDANKMREGLQYMTQYQQLDEVEVLWRLARFCYKTGKYHTKDQAEKKRLAEQGWAYVERALALGGDKSNGCRRWAGILLSWSSEFEGTKKKIEKSFEIKEHFERATECDAKDATSMHLLGQWCYSVVSVPWYQRQIATVLFATPPQSTYEEALSHFEAAEKADPGFYMVNWLWIGKCHLAMGHKQEARPWLEQVVSYETSLEEELEAKKEAEALLGKL